MLAPPPTEGGSSYIACFCTGSDLWDWDAPMKQPCMHALGLWCILIQTHIAKEELNCKPNNSCDWRAVYADQQSSECSLCDSFWQTAVIFCLGRARCNSCYVDSIGNQHTYQPDGLQHCNMVRVAQIIHHSQLTRIITLAATYMLGWGHHSA